MAEAAIGLGSNLGDKAANIEAAIRLLGSSADLQLISRSRLYRTEPWGDADQDWFLNACALVETALDPHVLLARCLATEDRLGRTRDGARRWGPRVIDLDLLFYGDVELDEAGLTLPHPRLFERAFVIVPLAEIAGDREISGQRVGDAAGTIDRGGVRLWEP
jgi:2-amino-4-hydroxy-6-hydroxymethyldihydropteridine diphosphokinase